jgi:2,3-dihydroxy-p-cumate/2,3-dihydroxybenzoate 3,4-dioxygenase
VIDLWDICYVRLGTRDPAGTNRFAEQVLGLEHAHRACGADYFRSDDRDHTLVTFEGDPRDHTVGFELRTPAELDRAAGLLSNAGVDVRTGSAAECEQRRAHAFVNLKDPSGNSIDLVVQTEHGGHRFSPPRDAGITGFSHVGLCSTDCSRDERFWTDLMGARVSDRIGPAALLRIDEVHHKIALFPTTRAGVQHVNHQVASVDDVMRAWYRLRAHGVRIVAGPGRHPTSGAVFLYFQGPDDMVYEYSTGVRQITAEQEKDHRPRQFPMAPASFCMWGSVVDSPEFLVT